MSKFKYCFLILTFLIIFAGCEKEEELLEGIWERIIVENINAGFTEEWHFFDEEITIRRINNDDPSDIRVIDRGIYKLKPVFDKTYLSIFVNDPTWPGYNADWEVVTLDDEVLVILHDVYGGITKREFTKK